MAQSDGHMDRFDEFMSEVDGLSLAWVCIFAHDTVPMNFAAWCAARANSIGEFMAEVDGLSLAWVWIFAHDTNEFRRMMCSQTQTIW